MESNTVIVLGADGYLGWVTCMHLAAQGDTVIAVDNYSKRAIAEQTDSRSLIVPASLEHRSLIWNTSVREDGEGHILPLEGDITDYSFISQLLADHQPDTIIHYAEQPSGPYSLISQEEGEFTLVNNLLGTHNLLWAMLNHCRDAHLIKLGTMGEYGTPNIDIPEGWLEIDHNGRKDTLLFPRAAGSLYHTTKVLDTDLIWFFVRMFDLRVSDIMQGPVYGIHTPQTIRHPKLQTTFYYDDIFGTVVNRFIAQAVAGVPLTVYGEGNQIRGYINICDVVQCIDLVSQNPAQKGELSIYNQITESLSVNEIARKVKGAMGLLGLDCEIQHIDNPRREAENHHYSVEHKKLRELGLREHLMDFDMLMKMIQTIIPYKEQIREDIIMPRVTWHK